ncbi:mitochondrial import inner membrane translocase subunit Tim23-like, partial [Paramacrobiotus metropolitanus]|uniref:mitochondrial import inner membrane translocase subunit Tim23-like n=1 Tax=Paramacrobiotus metropolitanus TaxID=2943436 RepID=UPI0024461788
FLNNNLYCLFLLFRLLLHPKDLVSSCLRCFTICASSSAQDSQSSPVVWSERRSFCASTEHTAISAQSWRLTSGVRRSPFASGDPSLGLPVFAGAIPALSSPYLNFDPAVLQEGPQYIFPEGAANKRGRFELAFSQIGGSVMTGALIGGTSGIYTGLRDTSVAGLTGGARRAQILNYVSKRGASYANGLGVLAVMYSGFGVIISKLRGTDDELNTLMAGTATGLLYKSTAGLRRCAMGGAGGLAVAAAYCLLTSGERVRQIVGLS